MKGSYTLIIQMKSDKIIQIGKLGNLNFNKGYYIYVGSAMNSLKARINRHISKEKKIYWHIDYLLAHSKIKKIVFAETAKKIECELVHNLGSLDSIPYFGSSDCQCKSHLFYSESYDVIFKLTINAFKKCNVAPKEYIF